MKRIISSILVIAMLLTLVPSALAGTLPYEFGFAQDEFTVNVGETVDVPFYISASDGSAITMFTAGGTVVYDEGLEITAVTSGLMTLEAGAIDNVSRAYNFANMGDKSYSADLAVGTLTFKATKAGTYNIGFAEPSLMDSEWNEYYDESINAKTAKIVVTEPGSGDDEGGAFVPSDKPYIFGFIGAPYAIKEGETIDVPIYISAGDGSAITMFTAGGTVVYDEGLEITAVTSGLMTLEAGAIDNVSRAYNFANMGDKSYSADLAVGTLTFKATKAGTYNIGFAEPSLMDSEWNEYYDESIEARTATITVGAGAAPAPVLTGIEVAPKTITVPYVNQADIKGYVEANITAVTGKYSDGSSAAVAGYTVAVEGTTATVSYETFTDTIDLTLEPAPVVLTGIEVAPKAITVPYANQNDVKGYVEGAITAVTAKYSDGTSKAVTSYTVAVEGTTATVTYEDKITTIDLTLESAPVVSDKAYVFGFIGAPYSIKVGETIDVPIYISAGDGSAITMFTAGGTVVYDEGLEITAVTSGLMTLEAGAIDNVSRTYNFANMGDKTYSADLAVGTLTFKATKTGTFNIGFAEPSLMDSEWNEYYDESIEAKVATVSVEAGAVVPDPEPSLVVNPTAIEVPYGADVVEYIKANAKVYYYADVDAEAADVTAEAVITEDGVVTYNGLTANIAVTKVTLVDIELSTLEKIVVPYGTADVKTYVEAEAAKIEVTAKYSNNTSAVVPATVEYAGNVVTISYDGIAKTVEVEEIKAVAIGVVPNTDIVVPYGSDVAEYIKTAVRVQVETSNGEKVAPIGEVAVVDNGDGTATVTADGCEATVTYTIGANPEDIASIEVTAGELVVPYGADAAAYIAANVTVTATKNSGATEVIGITAENVVAVDGVATITVEGCEATVNYTVETITGIEAAVEALDLAWDADVEAAVKAVAVYYVYSANTANSVVPAEDIAYEIGATEAVITVGEYTATIALNIAAKPAYFVEEVAPAYDLDGHKAIVISMNVEGVPYVNGVAAVKVADAKFVFVTDEEYTIEVKEETADIVAWGTLHRDDMVTALDALMALNAADGVIADEFKADDNTYIKADIDLNYDITATDALGINNISLGKTTVVTMAE